MNKGTPADPLREAIGKAYDAALNAVGHVGAANYADREQEAKRWVHEAFAKVDAALATKPAEPPAPFGNESKTLLNAQTMEEAKDALRGGVQPPAPEPLAWLVTRRVRQSEEKRATYLFGDLKSAQYEYEGWLDYPHADPKLIPLSPPITQRGAAPESVTNCSRSITPPEDA